MRVLLFRSTVATARACSRARWNAIPSQTEQTATSTSSPRRLNRRKRRSEIDRRVVIGYHLRAPLSCSILELGQASGADRRR